jgi:hypothetical protein
MLTSYDTATAVSLPVVASDILSESHSLRATADAAEALILVKACEWADFHPALEDDMVAFEDENLPAVHFDCTATFALNIGLRHGRHQPHPRSPRTTPPAPPDLGTSQSR